MIPPAPLKLVGNRFVLSARRALHTTIYAKVWGRKKPMKGNIFIGFFAGVRGARMAGN